MKAIPINRRHSMGNPEQALIVSLRTYHQQLKTQSGEVNPGGDAEFNEAVDTLFNAWADSRGGA